MSCPLVSRAEPSVSQQSVAKAGGLPSPRLPPFNGNRLFPHVRSPLQGLSFTRYSRVINHHSGRLHCPVPVPSRCSPPPAFDPGGERQRGRNPAGPSHGPIPRCLGPFRELSQAACHPWGRRNRSLGCCQPRGPGAWGKGGGGPAASPRSGGERDQPPRARGSLWAVRGRRPVPALRRPASPRASPEARSSAAEGGGLRRRAASSVAGGGGERGAAVSRPPPGPAPEGRWDELSSGECASLGAKGGGGGGRRSQGPLSGWFWQ